jgi:hypothetical protein
MQAINYVTITTTIISYSYSIQISSLSQMAEKLFESFQFTSNCGDAQSAARWRRRPEITSLTDSSTPIFQLLTADIFVPSVAFLYLLAFENRTQMPATRNQPLGGALDREKYYQTIARTQISISGHWDFLYICVS